LPGNDIQGGFASHIVVPRAGCAWSTRRALAKAGLSHVAGHRGADALTTPYQAVRKAGVTPGTWRW